jgi:hypothetical protein
MEWTDRAGFGLGHSQISLVRWFGRAESSMSGDYRDCGRSHSRRHRGNFYEEIVAPADGRACSWTRCLDVRRRSTLIVAAGLFDP